MSKEKGWKVISDDGETVIIEGKIPLQSISASARWLQCTVSLIHNQEFVANVNTVKGNLIHEVSALRLREIFFEEDHKEEIERLKSEPYVDRNDPSIIAKWDNDCTKTSEGYVEYAIKLYHQFEPDEIEVEKEITLNWYGYKKKGYIDLVMKNKDHIVIVDLKTGRGRVETEDNSQMLMYAIAKAQEELDNKTFFIGNYIVSIFQPLINNTQAFQYSLKQLTTFYHSHREKMNEIIKGELKYDPSPEACRFCDYRHKCNARIKKGIL